MMVQVTQSDMTSKEVNRLLMQKIKSKNKTAHDRTTQKCYAVESQESLSGCKRMRTLSVVDRVIDRDDGSTGNDAHDPKKRNSTIIHDHNAPIPNIEDRGHHLYFGGAEAEKGSHQQLAATVLSLFVGKYFL